MDIIYEIRRRHSIQKQSISAIARDMGLSRQTVRKHLNTITEPKYEREQPASPTAAAFSLKHTELKQIAGRY
jgi:predicted transcriptional regulator